MSQLKVQTLELIGRALRDELEIEEASFFLSSLQRNVDSTLSDAVHAVVHFVIDTDLRARDKAYDAALRVELESYAEALRTP